MQPTPNRPVYIVRPAIITTNTNVQTNPSLLTPTGATTTTTTSVHPLATVRPPLQTRPIISSPVYAPIGSPQQAVTRLIKPEPGVRSAVRAPLPTNVSTTPTSTSASSTTTASSSASNSKDIAVRVMKSDAIYGIMEFASGISIDLKDGNSVEMKREINPFTYRAPSGADPNGNASSNTIITSLGAVVPKTGAGSEYGREQKEALKRKRYATKGTNLEDLPWLLTNRITSEKKSKHFRGMKKGGIATNSSYYVFIQTKDGFDAYPVSEWYGFTTTNLSAPIDYDEVEKRFQERNKKLSKWISTHQPKKEKDADEEEDGKEGQKSSSKKKSDFQLLDIDEFKRDPDEDDTDDEEGGSKKKKSKKSKSSGATLTDEDDDDDDERNKMNVKKKKKSESQGRQRTGEDSDDGDHDDAEVDYTSDETSEDEDDLRDANTLKTAMRYEVKGIDEELKPTVDIAKKLELMDDDDGIDFDDDDEEVEVPDVEDQEEENGENDDLADGSKSFKNDTIPKEIESSSDDDDMDDFDDGDGDPSESASASTQPNPAEQIRTEKGHKKARDEEMREIKSKVISLSASSSASSNPADGITDEKVRALLIQRKQMTFKELIQKFLPKAQARTPEIKKEILNKLAAVIQRLNIEHKEIDGKKYIKLKN